MAGRKRCLWDKAIVLTQSRLYAKPACPHLRTLRHTIRSIPISVCYRHVLCRVNLAWVSPHCPRTHSTRPLNGSRHEQFAANARTMGLVWNRQTFSGPGPLAGVSRQPTTIKQTLVSCAQTDPHAQWRPFCLPATNAASCSRPTVICFVGENLVRLFRAPPSTTKTSWPQTGASQC